MNEALLIEVLAHIHNHPESWSQNIWLRLDSPVFTSTAPPVELNGRAFRYVAVDAIHCGTSGCLAGWTTMLAPQAQVYAEVWPRTDGTAYTWRAEVWPRTDGTACYAGGTTVVLDGRTLTIEEAAAELLGFDPNEFVAPECDYYAEFGDDCPGHRGDGWCRLHSQCWDLFDSDNQWDDLIRISAFRLGITTGALENRVYAFAQAALAVAP